MRIYVKFPDGTRDEYEVEAVEFPEKVIVEINGGAIIVREPGCEVE